MKGYIIYINYYNNYLFVHRKIYKILTNQLIDYEKNY